MDQQCIFTIGFDADDTLWHCENHFAQAQAQFAAVLELGGRGIHVPYVVTARHEQLEAPPPGTVTAGSIADIPDLVRAFEVAA